MRSESARAGTTHAVRPSRASAAMGKPKCTPASGTLTFFQLRAASSL